MLNQRLLVLVAAGLITIAAPFVAAQDSSNDQSQSMGHGHHHGMPNPAQRTAELTKRLNLTSDQQAKVKAALESQRSQMESLHQDSSLSQDDRHAKMMDIHKSTSEQIRGTLDATQQKKWDEMEAKHGEWGHNHQGAPDADSNPQK